MKRLLLLIALPTSLLAAELPPPVIPAGVGVNIHFTRGREADLDMIAAAGFKFVRMDFTWQGIERKKGEYDWSAYDDLTANLEKRGLRAIYILDYSNPLYEETITLTDKHTKKERKDIASPQRPESVEAFARWAGAAAKHFNGRHIIWEIWNEPNISFWKPKPDVNQYVALALATCKAVRAADPKATIVAPASSGFPWEFFETMFASGLLKYLDAVSVHPYRPHSKPPETAAADYAKLRGLIAKYAPAGKKKLPILSGEWGYATHDKGVSLETQAAFIVRQQLANLLDGVPLSIWYDWKNDGTDPAYNEHHFGTVDHQLKPKPSYLALQTMTRELSGYRVARRLATPDDDWVLLCLNAAGDLKLVAWTLGEPRRIELDLDTGRLPIELAALPKYIPLKQPPRVLALAAAWKAEARPNLLVEAGSEGVAKISVRVQNPFDKPLRATVEMTGFAQTAKPVMLNLPPHRSADADVTGIFLRRDSESATAVVCLRFAQQDAAGHWQEIGNRDTQPVSFIIANLLTLSVAPVERGGRTTILNPSLQPFDGKLRWDKTTVTVKLKKGAIQENVTVTAPASAGVAQLLDRNGNIVAEAMVPVCRPIQVAAFRTALDGDSKVPAKAAITMTEPPDVASAPASRAFRLDYDFEAGWRFVRCVPDVKPPLPIEGRPQAFGVWVFSDNSGCSLNLRLTDATGQTFQFGGPRLNWTGWRWVTFELSDARKAGHWGGANDGVVHWPMQWDCPLLLDGHRSKAAGTVYFAGMMLLSPPK